MNSNDVEMESQEKTTKEEVNDAPNKEEQDEAGRPKPKTKMYEGEIVEGKREKKTVQRLDMQMGKPKEKVKIESIGKGDKLGDIPRVNHAVGKLKAPLLKPLHKILYDRPGAVASLRKNIRLFNGFPFDIDSDPYNKKKEKMLRIPKAQLKTICQILDLERSGNQSVLVDRIMHFLTNPTNSGKPVILKKKKKKKTAKDAKREKKTASKSKQQQQQSGKSKAIVTDSSSDEEDDDDEDEGENKKDGEKSSVSDRPIHNADDSSSEEELEEDEEKEKTEDSEDDEKDSEDAETKKKPAAQKKVPAKTAAKTKKADSSSNRKKTTVKKRKVKSDSSDDDDDDQPLIKMVKKPPTNEQLKQAVKDLLKDANLEEVTMKQICQKVYDLYPDFDLTNRKEFIKDTVKSLIS